MEKSWRVLAPDDAVAFTGSDTDCLAYARQHAPAWPGSQCVVFLHALAGLPFWMEDLAAVLAETSPVANIAYPTLFENMAASVRRIRGILSAMEEDGIQTISLIGHSYGGLMSRALLRQVLPLKIDRIVMMGTPNQGSKLAAFLIKLPPYKWYFGPAGRDVLAEVAKGLPIPDVPTLVIAGGFGRYGINPLLSGDDDGVVTVEETLLTAPQVQGLKVRALHRLLPKDKTVIAAIVAFLKEES